MLAGLVLYAFWFGIKADRYDETAIPYLESAMPVLTSWQYDQLRPLLSPGAQLDFENEKVRAAYRSFGRLGRFQSMEKPRYMASRADSNTELGDIEIIEYQVELQFDSGPAVIKVKLVADGKSYHVRHFSFQSEIFAE
jgi:hypothetical protein